MPTNAYIATKIADCVSFEKSLIEDHKRALETYRRAGWPEQMADAQKAIDLANSRIHGMLLAQYAIIPRS